MFLSFNRKGSPQKGGRVSVSELSSGVWDVPVARWIGANSVGTWGQVEGDWNDCGTGSKVDLFLRFRLHFGRLGDPGMTA